MAVINTNVNAIIARNAGAVNERSMTNAMQQLSTGKRINVAADDAAGLAISTKMTSQIRGLDQAVRNANDGISMLQVAEGATVEMTNMLQRMRELAVQSRNDTNTDAERSYLNDEYTQLKSEINRIATTTQWNGQNILDGTGSIGEDTAAGTQGGIDVDFQVGANANQTVMFNLVNFATSTSATASTVTNAIDQAGTAAEYTGVEVVTASGTTIFQVSAGLGGGGLVSAADSSDWTTYASAIQTAMRTSAEFADITVTAQAGGELLFSEPNGAQFTSIKIGEYVDGNTTPATPTTTGTLSTGTVSNGTAATATTAGIFAAQDLDSSGTVGDVANEIGLSATGISSSTTAEYAIAVVDEALSNLNQQRSLMGAMINRLTYAADNLTNTSANVNAARSRVLDTDYAQATTELARTQIIQQASTAMLAQANQGAQSVLSLLK